MKPFFLLTLCLALALGACRHNDYHTFSLAPTQGMVDTPAVHLRYVNRIVGTTTFMNFTPPPLLLDCSGTPIPRYVFPDTFSSKIDSIRFTFRGVVGAFGRHDTTYHYTTLPRNGKHHYLYIYNVDSVNYGNSPPYAGAAAAVLEQQAPPSPGMFRLRLGHFFERFKGNVVGFPPASTPTYSVLLADGTPVAGLQNVHYGHFSPDVELPYGTYAFRVRDNFTNTELPYFPINIKFQPFIPAPIDQAGQHQFYYAEGSTYTMLCLPANNNQRGYSEYVTLDREVPSSTVEPGQVAQVAYLNAATDGGSFTSPSNSGALALGQSTGIQLLNPGPLQVSFQGKDSTLTSNLTINRLNNWLVVSLAAAGMPGIMVLPTYLPNDTTTSGPNGPTTSIVYCGTTYLSRGNNANIYVRFLNLSPDAGNIAFVGRKVLNGNVQESVIDPSVSGSVPFGKLLSKYPFTSQGTISEYATINLASPLDVPIHIAVRQATSNPQIPGNLINSVELDYPFVANPAQFTAGGVYAGPVGQPGVYTIALVGSVSPTATDATKARIVVIHHTR